MLARALPSIVLCALTLSACGASPDAPDRAATTATAPRVAPMPNGATRNPLELPANVPLKPSGASDPARVKVIRTWSDALRNGDVAGASAAWAVPSKVQNGSPVLTLASRSDVRIFNAALSCGSVVTKTGGAGGGFTIVTVRLTRRPGADCGSGTGHSARTAILVRGGRIVEWYRLPDDPNAPGLLPQSPPDSFGSDATTV